MTTVHTTSAPDGATIAFTDSQTPGPPVVLVHGITESRRSWDPVAERLTATNQVIALDLRGHGESGHADRYDLEAMAGDVIAVLGAAERAEPAHLVGHSLGGAVVSAVGAAIDVASVVNVDQPLRLGAFKEALAPAEEMLRDPSTFPAAMDAIFADMVGPLLEDRERSRVQALRRADQDVVLGVWELIFAVSAEEIDAVVEAALAGYSNRSVPYLSLFGIDPGHDYEAWLCRFIADAEVEIWPDHGHYPHLVDPGRFVARLRDFWSGRNEEA